MWLSVWLVHLTIYNNHKVHVMYSFDNLVSIHRRNIIRNIARIYSGFVKKFNLCSLCRLKFTWSAIAWNSRTPTKNFIYCTLPTDQKRRYIKALVVWSRYTWMSRLPETYFVLGIYDLGTLGCPGWPGCVYCIQKSVEKLIIICQ